MWIGASIISNTNILHTYLKAIPNNFGMAFCLSKNYSYLCYMGNWEKQQDEKKKAGKEINPVEKTWESSSMIWLN